MCVGGGGGGGGGVGVVYLRSPPSKIRSSDSNVLRPAPVLSPCSRSVR